MDIAIRKIVTLPDGTLVVVDENDNFIDMQVRFHKKLSSKMQHQFQLNDVSLNYRKRKIANQDKFKHDKDRAILDFQTEMSQMESTMKLLMIEIDKQKRTRFLPA